MKKVEIKKGEKFGRLTYLGKDKYINQKVKICCLCECGVKGWYDKYHVRSGHTISCGCFRLEKNKRINTKHGFAHKNSTAAQKRTYKSWQGMKSRCDNPNNHKYPRYGGRKIKYSKSWKDFDQFVKDMGLRPKNKTIDRIDNNGDYCKENCKWSTVYQQNRNRENTIMITYKGKTQCMTDWAKELDIREGTLQQRIYRGMNPVKALEM